MRFNSPNDRAIRTALTGDGDVALCADNDHGDGAGVAHKVLNVQPVAVATESPPPPATAAAASGGAGLAVPPGEHAEHLVGPLVKVVVRLAVGQVVN